MKRLFIFVFVFLIFLIFLLTAGISSATIYFTSPTPANNTFTNNQSIEINTTINENNLANFYFTFNNSNYVFYNNSLQLALNFNNVSELGENVNSTNVIVYDYSPMHRNCVHYGDINYTNGTYGGAFYFDGSGDFFDCGANNITGNHPFSLEAWINTQTFSKYSGAISIGLSGTGKLVYIGTVTDVAVGTPNSIGGGFYGRNYGTGLNTINTWYHVVLTYNGSTVKMYVNGVEKISDNYTPNITSDYVRVGRIGVDTAYDFQGMIDEPRIYDYALTPDEVKMHFYSNFKKTGVSNYEFYSNISNLTTYKYYFNATENNLSTETRLVTTIYNCPVITASGYYKMLGNFTGAPNNASPNDGLACVKIMAPNVDFDCNGYSITNNGTAGTTYGVLSNNTYNKISNCIVSGYSNGVYLSSSAYNTVYNNTLINNTNGMWVRWASDYTNITNNIVANNTQLGILLDSSPVYCTVKNNTITNNSVFDLYLYNTRYNNIDGNKIYYGGSQGGIRMYSTTNYNNITNNEIYNTTNDGIVAIGLYNNTFINNSIHENRRYGVYISFGGDHILNNNTIYKNSNLGVYFSGSSNNIFTNNSLYNNNPHGFFEDSSSNYNVIANNTASNNTQYGFVITGSNYNNLTNNSAYYNQIGIYVLSSSANNTLTNNIIYNNSQYGLYLYSSFDNKLINNTVYNNPVYQIRLASSNNNLIYNNIFKALTGQGVAYDNGNNYWNTIKDCSQTNIIGGPCIGGNYYSDYNGSDADGDGLGDTPYIAGNIYDSLPIVAVYFIPPTPAGNYSMNELTSHFTIAARYLFNFTTCYVEINGVNKTGTISGQNCTYFWSGLYSIQYKVFFDSTSTGTRRANFAYAQRFTQYPSCSNAQLSYVYNIVNISGSYVYYLKTSAPSSYPDCAFDNGMWYVYWPGTNINGIIQPGLISGSISNADPPAQTGPKYTMSFYSPKIFAENKTARFGTATSGPNIDGVVSYIVNITNSTGGSISVSVPFKSNSLRYNLSIQFYDNKTICLNKTYSDGSSPVITCLLAFDTKYNFSLLFTTYGTTYTGSFSAPFCAGDSAWFCNPQYNIPVDDKYRFVPYISIDAAPNTSITFNNYNNLSIFAGKFTNEQFAATPYAYNLSTLIFVNSNQSGILYNLTNINTFISSGQLYNAYYLTTNAQIIRPNLVVFKKINNELTRDLYLPYYYSPSTYVSKAITNLPTFLVDEYGICYFVPPYSPANTSITQTLTAYQIPCSTLLTYSSAFPVLPYYQVCKVANNNTYVIDVRYSSGQNVLFERYIYDNVNNASVVSGSAYQENITYSNSTTLIELYANGVKRCSFNPQQQNILLTLPLNQTNIPTNMTTTVNYLLGVPIIMTTAALSTVHPFVFILTIAFNDVFHILSIPLMFVLAAFVGLFAFISNWHGERNLKTLLILLLILTVYAVQVHEYNAYTSSSLSQLSTLYQNLINIFSGISSTSDLTAIITTVLPTFLLNLIALLLSFPAVIIGVVFDALAIISPSLASALYPFQIALVAGAYVWIILKAYELGRNMFRPI